MQVPLVGFCLFYSKVVQMEKKDFVLIAKDEKFEKVVLFCNKR